MTSPAKSTPTATAGRIRGVLFDLDGLMFNTEVVFHLTGTEILRRRGKLARPEIFRAMQGRRAEEAWPVMIQMAELTDTIDALEAEAHELFPTFLEAHLAPMPGLLPLLETLTAAGVPRVVATSSGRDYARELLDRFKLTDGFDAILGAEDVSVGKPAPEIYQKAAAALALPPEETLVLEDTEAGINAGKGAGATAVAVPHEHSHGQTYPTADLVLDTLADRRLYELLGLSAPGKEAAP